MKWTIAHFQDTWAAKLPWVEYVVGADGKVHQVQCKVCNKIKECDKLLMLKLDSLWKHVGHKKVVSPIANVTIREYIFLKTNQHVFNECLYVSMGGYFEPCSCRCCDRTCSIAFIFHLLYQGRPMMKYEKNYLILKKCLTILPNIGMIVLVGKLLKTCTHCVDCH
jgi:hypothetical protein